MSGELAQLRAELNLFAANHNLTPRGHDVMFLLISGLSSVAQIADNLNLSHHTIDNHFKNVFQRTGTTGKADVLSLFIREIIRRHAAIGPFVKYPKVLLVDPSDQRRESESRSLEQRGIAIVREGDPTRALDRIAEHMIDTVIVDEGAMKGMSLLGDIKDRFGKAVAVLVASEEAGGSASHWLHEGAVAVFKGPLDTDRVLFCILEHFVNSPYERKTWEL